MIALIILFVFAVYLLISALVTWGAVRIARRRGIKGWKFGVPAALGMYLLVFWDHIPTILLYKYHCATEAGFWIYKTPEQWKKEHPGIAETLVPTKGTASENGAYILNQRFRWSVKKTGPHPVNIWRHEQEVIDHETGEVMARYVDFSSGYGNPLVNNRYGWKGLKIWIAKSHCLDGKINQDKLGNIMELFENIRGFNG